MRRRWIDRASVSPSNTPAVDSEKARLAVLRAAAADTNGCDGGKTCSDGIATNCGLSFMPEYKREMFYVRVLVLVRLAGSRVVIARATPLLLFLYDAAQLAYAPFAIAKAL